MASQETQKIVKKSQSAQITKENVFKLILCNFIEPTLHIIISFDECSLSK